MDRFQYFGEGAAGEHSLSSPSHSPWERMRRQGTHWPGVRFVESFSLLDEHAPEPSVSGGRYGKSQITDHHNGNKMSFYEYIINIFYQILCINLSRKQAILHIRILYILWSR